MGSYCSYFISPYLTELSLFCLKEISDVWRQSRPDGAVISLKVIILNILFWSTQMKPSSDGYVEPRSGRPQDKKGAKFQCKLSKICVHVVAA